MSKTHLNDIRLQAPVKQDVKSKDLKAGAALHMVGEAGAVVVLEDGVGRDHCLNDGIINVIPQLIQIHSFALQVAVDCADPSTQDSTDTHQVNIKINSHLCDHKCNVCERQRHFLLPFPPIFLQLK